MPSTTGTPQPNRVINIPVEVSAYDGMGPLYFRDTLATATEGDVTFEITRIMPMGLHVRATRDGHVVDLVANERLLIETLCASARDRLPKD